MLGRDDTGEPRVDRAERRGGAEAAAGDCIRREQHQAEQHADQVRIPVGLRDRRCAAVVRRGEPAFGQGVRHVR
jgi:hypothetical protein